MEKFYITTAIAYTSVKPHIGNTYEAVLSDSIARFKRMQGYDVFFLTGTDEHGQKIEEEAKKKNISPKQYVDGVSQELRSIWDLMNTSYDKFIRTTDDYHEKAVQKIFQKLYEKGDIYKGEYEGLYCVPCESFFTESQLVDGKCPDCGREVKKTKEEAYFFKMSKYQDRLMEYIETHPDFIMPKSREKEMVNNFIKPGLQDLCVSRTSFKWGVPVPFDDKHVIYVWIDALSNYITALGYDAEGNSPLFEKNWPADVHIIGKDILRFHTIYWPIMLMALDLPLPKQIFGHPFLLFGEDKMSKSKGNVMYADDLVKLFGVDAMRFYLLHEMPYAQDGSITYETIIARYNSELANTLGNLLNRTVAMIGKYFDGIIPARGPVNEYSEELENTALNAVTGTVNNMQAYKTADALDEIWNLVRRSNKYIDETMPWVLAKEEQDREKLQTVLYDLAEALRFIGVLLQPFMPDSAKNLLAQIGAKQITLESLNRFGQTQAGTAVQPGAPLFARIDEKEKTKEIEALLQKQKQEIEEAPNEIDFSDFEKLDLRAAKVLTCEKVEKADKLLQFTLDLGTEQRTVVSGIAKYYKPEELVGKTVVMIANLKPAKIRGIVSQGMILSAESDGKLRVTTIDGEVAPGSKVM